MANIDVLNSLYTKSRSALEFNFDMLTAPPLLSLITQQDIFNLNSIARSVKLSGKIDEKYKLIDKIMNNRGFIKLHAGTNRVVYRFIEDQRFVVKVAVDRVGLGDNPAEFTNQFLLKPFVTKVFEVSPCGTISLVERVDAVMSREEFMSIADDVFNLITKFFVGKYILEDFGTYYFMNWAIRKSFGPVLLDFPYVYELDGNKLFCNAHPIPGRRDIVCGGELDYDDGFNNLICTKCRRPYQARDLKKAEKDQLIIVGGKKTMKVRIKVGSETIWDSSKRKTSKVIEPAPTPKIEEIPVEVDNKDHVENSTTAEDIKKFVEAPNRVESRIDTPVVSDQKDQDVNIPKDTIFNKKGNDDMKKYNTVGDTMYQELDKVIEEETQKAAYEENSYNEYDDETEYSQYMNNRERKKMRKENKNSKRRNNSNFDGF